MSKALQAKVKASKLGDESTVYDVVVGPIVIGCLSQSDADDIAEKLNDNKFCIIDNR